MKDRTRAEHGQHVAGTGRDRGGLCFGALPAHLTLTDPPRQHGAAAEKHAEQHQQQLLHARVHVFMLGKNATAIGQRRARARLLTTGFSRVHLRDPLQRRARLVAAR